MDEIPTDLRFSPSTRCETGACFEVARHEGRAYVRDSKQTNGPVLAFDRAAWTAFIDSIKGGEGGS